MKKSLNGGTDKIQNDINRKQKDEVETEKKMKYLIETTEKISISENLEKLKNRNAERRRTQLIPEIISTKSDRVLFENESQDVENTIIDDLFFSNVPFSDSEEIHFEYEDKVSPPFGILPGWHWNSEKLEYYLSSKVGRIRRKLYISPRVFGGLKDHPHQYDGVRWMWNRFKRSEGGILADDMGLGKTVQICVFLGGLFRSEIVTFILIILPASLMIQWKEELEKWCPKVPKYIYHGVQRVRDESLQSLYINGNGGVLITTFETFRNEKNKLESINLERVQCRYIRTRAGVKTTPNEYLKEQFNQNENIKKGFRIPWDLVIVDEAHKLKNNKTKLFKDFQSLDSYCNILCTGTPFQNKLVELWSLIQCVKPNLLGKTVKVFNHNYMRFISRLGNKESSEIERKEAEMAIKRLKCTIKPFILRRTKQQLALEKKSIDKKEPECLSRINKFDLVLWHSLSREQSESYQEVLDSRLIKRLLDSSDEYSQGKKNNGDLLEAFNLLLKICKHPLLSLGLELQSWRNLLENKQLHEEEPAVRIDAYQDSIETKNCKFDNILNSVSRLPQLNVDLLRNQSSKLQILEIIIPQLIEPSENKVLIFSESLLMLDLIELTILTPNNLDWERLEGRQSLDQRNNNIQSFNNKKEKKILLLSKHVGSTGLNLTKANRVILVEPHWNPTQDEQAISRAYRIGQKRDVIVYRLIAAGTIEDWKFRLQLHKAGFTKTFLGEASQEIAFSKEELKCLFSQSELESEDIQEIIFKFNLNDRHFQVIKKDLKEENIANLEHLIMAYLDFENIQKLE
ncbi:protein CHROMATIN REMODELING 24 isoform X1 [Cryptosporidium felis]|nr:protein CHROMATIN REMODELING 24 isoform X1 [Cryptosporidium felis]